MSAIPMFGVSLDEARLLDAASFALQYNEARGDCVWVCISALQRTWVIETHSGRFEFIVDESHPPTPLAERWLPVSERIIDFVLSVDDESTVLSLVDDTVVATSEHVSAAIDLVEVGDILPGVLLGDLDIDAVAVLSVPRINTLLAVARTLPAGVVARETIMPPMWLQFTEGQHETTGDVGELGAHVDWSDAFDSRSTFRATTSFSKGNATVAVYPGAFTSLLEMLPGHDTVSIGVGAIPGSEERQLFLMSGDWKFAVPSPHPLLVRWASSIERLVGEDEDAVVHQREGTEWILGVDDSLVRLTLHHGHPDMARVSAVVVNGVDTTPELLLELNELNIASTSLRYCVADGAVQVIVDVPCTHLVQLVGAARDAVAAVRQYMDVLRPMATVGSTS